MRMGIQRACLRSIIVCSTSRHVVPPGAFLQRSGAGRGIHKRCHSDSSFRSVHGACTHVAVDIIGVVHSIKDHSDMSGCAGVIKSCPSSGQPSRRLDQMCSFRYRV